MEWEYVDWAKAAQGQKIRCVTENDRGRLIITLDDDHEIVIEGIPKVRLASGHIVVECKLSCGIRQRVR